MSTTSELPQLPLIENSEILLDVCTHKDIKPVGDGPCGWADNDRLEDIGSQIVQTVVTECLFSKRPPLPVEDIKVNFSFAFSAI